ncbi:MAG: hypothetical protein KKA07_01395 [Bacteroidetes bacterium]|nr:hypothetical protein [Bacteroidota bacterium]
MRILQTSILGLFLLISAIATGQVVSARMYVSGGVVNFAFNSLQKYKSGITYTDYTMFNIIVKDANAVSTCQWRLYAKGLDTEFKGDNGVSTLDLALKQYLFLVATAAAGPGIVGGPATPTAGFFISDLDQDLVTAGFPNCIGDINCVPAANAWNTISISYQFGVANPIFDENETPDTYFLDIEFTLEAVP